MPQSCALLFKLGHLLNWNPLSLRLAGCSIALMAPSVSTLAGETEVEKYLALLLEKFDKYGGNFKQVPPFHGHSLRTMRRYTEDYTLLVVLYLTMCQIEGVLSGQEELLACVHSIQSDLLTYIWPRLNSTRNEFGTREEEARNILETFGLITKCEESGKYFHICGNHLAHATRHMDDLENEEDERVEVGESWRGYNRYNWRIWAICTYVNISSFDIHLIMN